MKIKIKRFDKNLSLPEHKTAGAACFDLTARETVKILPGEVGYVPLNVAIQTPKNHFLLLAARSSTHKKGLMMANGMGIGDPDFSGDGDEYHVAYLNFTNKPVTVAREERIAQGTFVSFKKASWKEVKRLRGKTRGGFGTTGSK